jgi:aryl-alcohol dehydrogenase-like predicted oxidoreductase
MLQKIALGTVQFGIPYGINNHNGVLSFEEIEQILRTAASAGITLLDTAPVYGDAEEKIGRFSKGGFKVVTKLPAREIGQPYSKEWLYDSVHESIKRLNVKKIYGLLLHKPGDLLEMDGGIFFSDLQNLKQEGLVDKIGISIYEPSELDVLFDNYFFDIVQAPFNILDRRMIDSGWMDRLYKKGIEFHVRSVFLQGLLLMSPQIRPSKFKRWDSIWTKYDAWLVENKISALQACLMHVLSYKEINNVIIGIDSLDHLQKILHFSRLKTPLIPQDMATNDTDLLNPLSWLKF